MSPEDHGALVISLDFELHWGIRDRRSSPERVEEMLLGTRRVIPRLLDTFEEFEVSATWAVVGFLFARDREELRRFSPSDPPPYRIRRYDPYLQVIGSSEREDPLHYAPTLVERIEKTPGQEIATHTFSHFFCLEDGPGPDDFRADLEAAIGIAGELGIELTSIVFPRNQRNPEYDSILRDLGIDAYRGNPGSWMHRHRTRNEDHVSKRVARGIDYYLDLSGDNSIAWEELRARDGLLELPASFFVRPASPNRLLEMLRLRRLTDALRRGAEHRRLVHLWWHPHNFGTAPERNLDFLRRILEEWRRLRDNHGMCSLNMRDVSAIVRSRTERAGDSRTERAGD